TPKHGETATADRQENVENRSRVFCAESKAQCDRTEDEVRPGPESKGASREHNCRGGEKRNGEVGHHHRKMSRYRRIDGKKKHRSKSYRGTKGPAQGKGQRA